jgi:hypothetical protein
MLTRIVTAVVFSAGVMIPGAANATSPMSDGDVSVDTGEGGHRGATVTIGAENTTTQPGSSDDAAGPTTSASQRTCTYLGVEIDCTSSKGVWSEERQCFVQRMPGEVTEENPFQGHTDGSVYRCATPGSAGGGLMGVGPGSMYLFWAPAPGDAGAPALVDPVTLAERAVERMELAAPRIGMTPMTPGAPLLVGMDAWLWIDNEGPRAFGPITRSASAGTTTVTATAKVAKVVWEMGDGGTVTCLNAGTPWRPALGIGPSPTCGYRYESPSTEQRDRTFTVRATAHWRVDWEGAGQSGRILFSMSSTRDQEVRELQVLQTS